MDERKFRLITAFGEVIAKKNSFEFAQMLIEYAGKTVNVKVEGDDVALSEILICLLAYPARIVSHRAAKLLRVMFPLRFKSQRSKKIMTQLNEVELKVQRDFVVHMLITRDSNLYLKLKKIILRDKEKFRDVLIENLVNQSEAVQKNSADILRELFPNEFVGETYYDLMKQLPEMEKERLYNILVKRLEMEKNMRFSWSWRESFIRSAGALDYPPANALLEDFLHDPDPHCRWTLAVSLSSIFTHESIRMLIALLMDDDQNVRFAALNSLKKILPGYYRFMSAGEILKDYGMHKPIDLLKIMPERHDALAERSWNRLGYDYSIIRDFRNSPPETLIKSYIEKVKIAKQIDNSFNLRRLSESCGSDDPFSVNRGGDTVPENLIRAIKTYILLLSAQMPISLELIKKMSAKIEDDNERLLYDEIADELQNKYSIELKEGFKFFF